MGLDFHFLSNAVWQGIKPLLGVFSLFQLWGLEQIIGVILMSKRIPKAIAVKSIG